MIPDQDDDDVNRKSKRKRVARKVSTNKSLSFPKINWREVECTILEVAVSVYLLLYCIELLGHKAQDIVKAWHR